jgi:hypothetical protein
MFCIYIYLHVYMYMYTVYAVHSDLTNQKYSCGHIQNVHVHVYHIQATLVESMMQSIIHVIRIVA